MSAPGNDRAPRRDNRRATSGQAGSGTTTSVRRPSGSSAPDTQPSGDLADVVPLPVPVPDVRAEFLAVVEAVAGMCERLVELGDDDGFDVHRAELLVRCRPQLARASMDLLRFVTAPSVEAVL